MPHTYPLRRVFIIQTEADPQVPCRVLGLFTQRAELPAGFSVRKTGDLTMRIVVELEPPGSAVADRLAQRLRNIPTVLDVAEAWWPATQSR